MSRYANLLLNLTTILIVALIVYSGRANAEPSVLPASTGLTPSTLSYQGTLANASGQPINSPVNLTFRLYGAAAGGTALWTETQNAVTVTNGLFNVELGSIMPISESVWAESDPYLSIQVGSDSEMSPREKVGTVPIAAQAVTVPDGSISSNKLSLQHGKKCITTVTSVPLPGTWQIVPVPNSDLSFTLDQASSVMVWMDGGADFNGTGFVEIVLNVDNVGSTWTNHNVQNEGFEIKGQRIMSLGAGAHTISLSADSGNSGTLNVYGDIPWTQTCVNYVVLGE